MKTIAVTRILLAFLLLSSAYYLLNTHQTYAQLTTLSIIPATNVKEVDQSFTVNITITDVEFLNSWQAKIAYDSSLLYTNSTLIKEGPFLKGGGNTFFAPPSIGPNYLLLGGLITTTGGKVDGTGVVASVGFVVVDKGKTSLEFDISGTETRLVDTNDQPISFTPVNGLFYTTYPKASFYYLPNRSPPALDYIPNPSLIRDPVAGEPIIFNATKYTLGGRFSGSYDPDGTIASYAWNFGDGSTVTVATPVVSHVFAKNDTFSVTLTVTDSEGKSDAFGLYVGVQSAPANAPIARFTYSPGSLKVDQAVLFNASTSTPEGGSITNYVWNFGDNNVTTATGPTITHRYSTSGNVTVTLTVRDSEGLNSSVTKYVLITKLDTTLSLFLTPSTTITVGESVTINGTLSTLRQGDRVTIWYRLGESSWGILKNVTTQQNGYYTDSWKPAAGTYQLKAQWFEDVKYKGTESDVKQMVVQEPPQNILPYIIGGIVLAAIIAIVAFFFIKRK